MTNGEFSYNLRGSSQKGFFVPVIGYERTKPNHSFTSVRDYWLFHFVISGRGKYFVDGKTYNLGKNYGFIIQPGVETSYVADKLEPWEYCWIAVRGIDAIGLLEAAELYNKHYFSFETECIAPILGVLEELRSSENMNPDYANLRINAAFLEVMSYFVPKTQSLGERKSLKSGNIALSGAEYFMKNYSKSIGVNEAAAEIGVSRVYFSTLFTKEFGVPPKEYLTGIRIDNAKKLLSSTDLTLSAVAQRCGFVDVGIFTKNFKKLCGKTPNAYRKENSI